MQVQATKATKPLYATCPHCGGTLECFSRNGTMVLPAHHGKDALGKECQGTYEVAISPRAMR